MDIEAELEAADALVAAGKNTDALILMRSLFACAPENPRVLNGTMMALYLNGRYREAIKIFEAAPPQASNIAWTLNTLSLNYINIRNYIPAEQAIERARRLDPNNPEYLLIEAIIKISLRKFDIGLQLVSKFIAERPNDARGYQTMADLIQRHSVYSTAEENVSKMIYYTEKAFQLDPVRFRGRIALAWFYFAMKKYDKWALTLIGKWPVK